MADDPPERTGLLDDCRIMLRFALRQGLAITPELRHDIETVEVLLNKAELPSLCVLSGEFVRAATTPVPGGSAAAESTGAASPPDATAPPPVTGTVPPA